MGHITEVHLVFVELRKEAKVGRERLLCVRWVTRSPAAGTAIV